MADSNNLSIDRVLTSGLVGGIQEIGRERGLEPLDWRVLVVDECPMVEGAATGDDPTAACLEWAEALGMKEYDFDAGDGVRTWYLVDGIWEIEISTLAHAS